MNLDQTAHRSDLDPYCLQYIGHKMHYAEEHVKYLTKKGTVRPSTGELISNF